MSAVIESVGELHKLAQTHPEVHVVLHSTKGKYITVQAKDGLLMLDIVLEFGFKLQTITFAESESRLRELGLIPE